MAESDKIYSMFRVEWPSIFKQKPDTEKLRQVGAGHKEIKIDSHLKAVIDGSEAIEPASQAEHQHPPTGITPGPASPENVKI